ncbi:hypothetical protein ABIB25_005166 [Nakamurella sp. UYEF19]
MNDRLVKRWVIAPTLLANDFAASSCGYWARRLFTEELGTRVA